MNEEKFFRMLGLAARARGIAFGEGAAKDAIRDRKAQLVVVAKDASENTKKKFRNSCGFYSVKMLEFSDKLTLGRYTGREFAVVLAVMNQGIAEQLVQCADTAESDRSAQADGKEF